MARKRHSTGRSRAPRTPTPSTVPRLIAPAPRRRTLAGLAIVVAAAALLAYWPARRAEFVNWDDDKVICNNPYFRGFSAEHLRWMFTQNKMGHYHPLTWLSYAVDHAISTARLAERPVEARARYVGQLDPTVFHLTNLVLHVAIAVAFLFLCVLLLRLAAPREAPSTWPLVMAATGAAILFGCHPLRVENVAWVTERRDLLSSLFLLPAVYCYLRYATTARTRTKAAFYLGSILLLGLSLLSKAWGITLPIILLLLDVFPLRRFGGDAGWSARRVARVLLEKTPHLVMAILIAFRAAEAQQAQVGTTKSLAEWGVADRLAQALYGLCFYPWKTLIPTGLTPLVELPVGHNPLAGRYLVAALVIILLVILLVVKGREWPGLTVAVACYVVLVSPVLGFMQSGPQFVADRYSYLATMPLAVLAGAGLLALLVRLTKRWSATRAAAVGAAGVLALTIGLCAAAQRQTRYWLNSHALWTRAVAVDPRCVTARMNLGILEKAAGRREQALKHYRAAYAVNDREPLVLSNLAAALREDPAGRDEALRLQEQAVQLAPQNCDIRYGYAVALDELGRKTQALEQAELCVRHGDPPRPKYHRLAARLYLEQADYARAEAEHLRALALERRLDPRGRGVIHSLDRLAWIARRTQRPAEAVGYYEEILKLDPANVDAQAGLRALAGRAR